jgi:hypothetical protein
MNFLIAMRDAAIERHRILVEFWYPPGPDREAAHVEHLAIVAAVYWMVPA